MGEGVDVWIHILLTLAIVGVSGQLYAPAHLLPGERVPGTRWVGGWVGLRCYGDVKICYPTETLTLTPWSSSSHCIKGPK